MRLDERGLALGVVLIMTILFSVAAYGIVAFTQGGVQRSAVNVDRLRARYAAEAGLVYASQRLWIDPNYPAACCAPAGGCQGATQTDTRPLDTDGNGTNETNVLITVTNCGANRQHAITARVVY